MNGAFILAMVLGIILGVVRLMTGHLLSGLFMLGIVTLLMSLRSTSDRSARLVIMMVAAVIGSGAFGFYAARSEITGKAIYYELRPRRAIGHPVTREESPKRFREATNYKWALSIFCVGVGVGCFYRLKLESSDPF